MAQIRGPFPFPIGSPANTGGAGEVMLASGGVYMVPPGEYLLVTGSQTVLEWFDPNNQCWRCYGQSGEFTTLASDGANYRLVNMSGVVVGASITNAGSGGTNGIGPLQTGSTVSFAAPAAGGATATANGYAVVGGSVQAPTITQGGSGFLVPPLILIDPPPIGGVQATATATISSAGVITAITMVNVGAGYTSTPNFYIVPQPQFYQGAPQYPGVALNAAPGTAGAAGQFPAPGLVHPNNVWPGTMFQANISSASGALLTPAALTGSGTLTAIVMTALGSGYDGTHIPTITLAGTSLGSAAATSIMSMCATAFSGSGGSSYSTSSIWISSLGLIANNNNNNTFFPRPARGIITSAAGAGSIEDPGFGLQKVPVVGVASPVANGTGATFTVTVGGQADVSVLQPMVQ
jgi:hypothetical protein